MSTQRLRRWAIITLIFILAAAILAESWQATVAAADAGGRPTPAVWPVTLEGLLAVLVLVYWDARSGGRRYAWVVQVAVWLVTAAAAAVQVLDAPATWLGWTTAALTPAMLLLAVEFAVWLLYGGVAAAQESTPRKVQAPRPSEREVGSVAVIGGHTVVPSGTPVVNEPRGVQSRVSATPPPSTPVQVAVDADSLTAGEAGSLPDEPRPVTPVATPPTDRGQTVAPLEAKHDEALRRRKNRPDEFEQYIAAKGLDRDAMLAMAARRGWPAANGHKKVPA